MEYVNKMNKPANLGADSRPGIHTQLAIMNGSAVIARVVAGIIADRFGVINTAVPTAFCIGVLSFAMLGATSTATAVTFDILYGLASG